MNPLIILGFIILAPIALVMLLRVNAAILFMSLCVGEVLVQYVGSDATSLIAIFSSHSTQLSTSTIKIALLFVPAILTALFMFHSVRGTRLILNIIPAIAVGTFTALLVEPLLSKSMQMTLEKSTIWHQFLNAQTLIVGVGALVSLLFLWIQHHGSRHSEHGRESKRR